MRNNLGNTEDKLEAQTIAQSEWERLSHMSLDELEANRNNFKTPYSAGTGSQYQVSVNLGEKGTFNNGTCGGVVGGYANCFKDTTITVYRDGNRLFTTRTLPLMAGNYTRKEIDNLLASMKNDYINRDNNLSNSLKNDYTSKYNTLANRLNGKEFVKNRTPNYDLNLRYEKKDNDSEIKLHAYNGNTEIPLGSSMKMSFGKRIKIRTDATWIAPSDGFILYTATNSCGNPWAFSRKIYLNGLEIFDLSSGEHGEENVNTSFPIAKGDVLKMVDTLSGTSSVWYSYAYFMPFE